MEPLFQTTDLGLAAYILAILPNDFREIVRENRRAIFFFADSDQLRELTHGWNTGTGLVPARLYSDALRALKSQIYEAQR